MKAMALLLWLCVPQVDPEAARAAGLDPAKLSALRPKLQGYVDAKQAGGIVGLVGRGGRTAVVEAVGFRDVESKDPMKADTIFRIASMTKPITAIAVLMLEDEGKLSVDDPVEKHLPEFAGQKLVQSRSGDTVTLGKPPRPITLKDLLTHTSGLPGAPPKGLGDLYRLRHRTLAEEVLVMSQQPLEFEPGSRWSYCNTGIDTLGRVVEVVSGKSFEGFLAERLFKPLGMKDTFFYPTAETLARTATIYKKDGDGIARSDNFIGDPVGGRFPLPAGGLYSTAADQARLYRMMLDRGTADGRRYLSEAAVEKMTRNHVGELKAGFTPGMGMGLGWQVVTAPEGVTAMLSPGTYGHGGAFGTQGWIDPARGMIFVLMVQRSNFGNGDASEIRRELQAVGVQAMVP
jgi:CubicO group peptidase (beta-lactamase class C family)